MTWRLVNYVTAVQALILPALWPAYSEAFAKGRIAWIRSTYSPDQTHNHRNPCDRMRCHADGGRDIIRLWAGPEAVPGSLLIPLMCVWIVILAFTMNQSGLMGATYRVGKQALFSSLAAVANLALSILWIKVAGVAGVLLATIVSYLIFIVVPRPWR